MRRFGYVLFAIAVAVFCMPLTAQTVDTAIQGTVADATGAVIPNATVTVTNPSTGAVKKSVTGSSGEFNVNYLIPGDYDVTVTANGFNAYSQKAINIFIGQQAKLNVSMSVVGATQTVNVEGNEQPLLQQEDASLGATIGPESAENLPLNGRKFDDLAVLTPGVQVSDPDQHSSSTGGSTVTSNGNQTTWGQAFLDGITMVNNRSAYINGYPSVDAVQEFNVLTANYGAQYGGGAGAIVNVQLKSGTNNWHGDIFEFIRNDAVDARNFFRPAPLSKVVLKQNQFGGVLTGPIIKDKTFFMISYEGIRSVQQNVSTSTVFTAPMRTGNFGAYSATLKNPYTGVAYPGNQIPIGSCQGCIDPNVQNIINTYMPLPNIAGTTTSTGPSNNYSGIQTGNESVDQIVTRIDDRINEKNQVNVHYLYSNRKFPQTGVDPAFSYTGTYLIHQGGMQWVHTFNQNMINEVRFGSDIEHVKQLPLGFYGGTFTAASIGIQQFTTNGQAGGPPLPPTQEGFPTISPSSYLGFGSGTAASNLDDSRTYELNDNLTWIKGHHTLLIGVDIRAHNDNATTNNTPFGSMSFSGTYTGASGADFLIGDPSSATTPEGVPLTLARQWRSGYYVQDNWKPTSKLTVNAGLRYDVFDPPHNLLTSSRTLTQSGSTVVLSPLPVPLWHITHKDFAPRLGMAYSLPWQSVVRAAYAITFYGGKFDNINILQLNPPIDDSFTVANGAATTNPATNQNLATFEQPAPSSLAAASANVASLPLDDNRPDLYLQTFNLSVSKQFWNNVLDVAYVAVKGTHQDTSIPYWNSGLPQYPCVPVAPATSCTTPSAQSIRPYPQFGRIRMVDFHGDSFFSSLQTKFEHRFSYGLSFTAAYTLGHLMDNQGGDTNGSRNETQIPAGKEWADGLTDQRHYLTTGVVWSPTLHTDNRPVRALLNGWTLTNLFSFNTSTPLFVTQSTDGEANDNAFERPDFGPGATGGVNSIALSGSQRTLNEWFINTAATSTSSCATARAPNDPRGALPNGTITNTSGYWAIACGHYGNVPRNPHTLRGPYHNPVTLGVSRSFNMPFNEKQKLLFRFEMFNALNEPQFGSPGATFGSSSFGVISSASDGRDLQAAFKYTF